MAAVSRFPFIYDPPDTIFTDVMPLNSGGMRRVVIGEDGDAEVAIFYDDALT